MLLHVCTAKVQPIQTTMYPVQVAPFLPASNIFFYVGTFIGERLLYLPSVGFCLLLADFCTGLLLPQKPGGMATKVTRHYIDRLHLLQFAPSVKHVCVSKYLMAPRHAATPLALLKGVDCLLQRPQVNKKVMAMIVALILASSAKTWRRNWEWEDEETLFLAAQKV